LTFQVKVSVAIFPAPPHPDRSKHFDGTGSISARGSWNQANWNSWN